MGVPPPIHPGAGAADRRRVGSRSRSACTVGSCRSCARCCRSDRRSTVSILEMVPVLCIRVHILASQLAITSKSSPWLFVRSSTASRVRHGFTVRSSFGVRSEFVLCSLSVQLPSTVHRHFTGRGSGCRPLCAFFAHSLLIAFLPLSMGSPTLCAKSVSFFIHLSTVYRLFEIIFPKISFFRVL